MKQFSDFLRFKTRKNLIHCYIIVVILASFFMVWSKNKYCNDNCNILAFWNYLVNEHGDVFYYIMPYNREHQRAASNRAHEHLAIVFQVFCPCVLRLCSGPWACRMAPVWSSLPACLFEACPGATAQELEPVSEIFSGLSVYNKSLHARSGPGARLKKDIPMLMSLIKSNYLALSKG